jgi:hypothetical protein
MKRKRATKNPWPLTLPAYTTEIESHLKEALAAKQDAIVIVTNLIQARMQHDMRYIPKISFFPHCQRFFAKVFAPYFYMDRMQEVALTHKNTILPHKIQLFISRNSVNWVDTEIVLTHGKNVSKGVLTFGYNRSMIMGVIHMFEPTKDPLLQCNPFHQFDMRVCYKQRVSQPYLLFFHYYETQVSILRQVWSFYPSVLTGMIIHYLLPFL